MRSHLDTDSASPHFQHPLKFFNDGGIVL